jgi:hypothetical protein
MNIARRKIDLIQRILLTEDKHLLKLIDQLFTQEAEKFKISKKDIKELDRLRKEHRSGKSKSYTIEEVREHADSQLKKRNTAATKKKPNEKK